MVIFISIQGSGGRGYGDFTCHWVKEHCVVVDQNDNQDEAARGKSWGLLSILSDEITFFGLC